MIIMKHINNYEQLWSLENKTLIIPCDDNTNGAFDGKYN